MLPLFLSCAAVSVLPLDTSLRTLPVGFYGSHWGPRSEDLMENMSKMTLLILMQNDGDCFLRCCPEASANLQNGGGRPPGPPVVV